LLLGAISADRDRIDHALHAAAEAGLAEHEQEFIGLVLGEFGGVVGELFQF
jgi:hypothetical protein